MRSRQNSEGSGKSAMSPADVEFPARSSTPKGGARAAASRSRIVAAALDLFSTRGYEGTSIRDIASAVGMTTASLYYHFSSKDELFVGVHGLSIDAMTTAVERAVEGITDPWDRLEAAAQAHCATLFDTDGTRAILTARISDGLAEVNDALVAQRDAYERLIQKLVDDLALPPDLDRKLLRLHILGVMNFLPTWFRRDGPLSAAEIGRQMVRHLRLGLEAKKPGGPTVTLGTQGSRISQPTRSKSIPKV
ncbi:MAG: TetR/AcrR family transcriptional regulator [Beijerinckiaceae bacterium]